MNVLLEHIQVERHSIRSEVFAPTREVHFPIHQVHLLRTSNAANAQVEARLAAKTVQLRGQLLQQHTANHARPDETNGNGVRRKIETGMHGTQGTRRIAAIDDHRDVALAGTLRNGADVHRGVTQGAEHLRSHTVRAGHAIAHHGKDGAAERDFDTLNLSFT